MRKLLFLALVLINIQTTASSKNLFAEALTMLEKSSLGNMQELMAIVTDPKHVEFLNPKEKEGYSNLQRVLNLSISYTSRDWLRIEDYNLILDSFAAQGMDFAKTGKESLSSKLLEEYVYDHVYNYQNIGLMIYEAILLKGYNPFYAPIKKGQSMFEFSINHIIDGSYYFDELSHHLDMNNRSEILGMSPFIWLTSNPNPENLQALKHLTLYDNDLNINERYDDGKTSAFDRAIALNNTQLAKILIEGKIDLHSICDNCASENYLHRIALYNSLEVFNILPVIVVEKLINQPDVNGKSPIFWALENENPELAIAYAKAGADLKLKNNDGESVMQVANRYAEANNAFIIVGREILDK